MEGEGRLLLSGSADHTMRLWDLGQQRCVATLAAHTDSVWALAASPTFASVVSGGRDGCIYRWAAACCLFLRACVCVVDKEDGWMRGRMVRE